MPITLDGQESVPLHPRHRLTDRGSGLVQPLSDTSAQRNDALLLEFEDGAQIHLGGIDQLAHTAHCSMNVSMSGRYGVAMVMIPAQFNGPDHSGNGGYTCGLLSEALDHDGP